jgi:uncharacterized protein YndB with AHSA1/START domain
MSPTATDTRSVIVERDLPYPAEKIWRALTQPHLIEAWLMKADFKPVVGHGFRFSADWGAIDCTVLSVEPPASLAYRWCSNGLDSVVTWTLTPAGTGTRLRMEHVGFKSDQKPALAGATAGWPRFLDGLEQVLAQID